MPNFFCPCLAVSEKQNIKLRCLPSLYTMQPAISFFCILKLSLMVQKHTYPFILNHTEGVETPPIFIRILGFICWYCRTWSELTLQQLCISPREKNGSRLQNLTAVWELSDGGTWGRAEERQRSSMRDGTNWKKERVRVSALEIRQFFFTRLAVQFQHQ